MSTPDPELLPSKPAPRPEALSGPAFVARERERRLNFVLGVDFFGYPEQEQQMAESILRELRLCFPGVRMYWLAGKERAGEVILTDRMADHTD